MGRRWLLMIAAVVIATAVIPRLAGAGGDDVADAEMAAPAAAVLPSAEPSINRTELDRLISVVTARLVDHDTYLDVRTLGELHLARADRDGDPADYDEAVRLLGEAHDRDPDDPEAATPLAAALLGIHHFAEAAQLADRVLAAHPDDLTAQAVAGDAALATGDAAIANVAFDRLAGLLPHDPSVAARRAELAWVTGEADEARELAAKAVDLARRLGLTGADLAFYLTYDAHRALDTGDHDTARGSLDEAIAIAPDEPAALAEWGRLLAGEGDLAAAEEAYRRSTDIRPDPATLTTLGEVRTALGDTAGAADVFATVEAVAALTAGEVVYRSALAWFHAEHGDAAVAVALARGEAEARDDAATWHTLSRALFAAGRVDEARVALDRALAWGVADARLLYQSGVVWEALGDGAVARHDLEAALGIDDSFHPIEAPAARALLAELP